MKLVTFDDIASLGITPAQCLDWVGDVIASKPDAVLPPKISLHPGPDGAFCNFMPCLLPAGSENRGGGIKLVTRYPGREPSLQSQLLLFDSGTGEMLALMDAEWITAMRTGAVAAHSIDLFARKGYRTVGLMGLGNTGRATLLMLAETLGGREVEVKLLRHGGQEAGFAERFGDHGNIRFTPVDTVEELVRGSEVVVSCVTYLGGDICEDSWFDEGVTLVPVHTRGFTNCDLFFDKVFADDEGHVCHFGNFSRFRSFAEVSDVVRGAAPGRENGSERILVYNIGLALHDISFAGRIYGLLDKSKLQDIDLRQPENKFWV